MTTRFYFIFVIFILFFLVQSFPVWQSRTAYNEIEAKALLNLAAGAYALSPEACVQKTFLSVRPRQLYSSTTQICDEYANTCGSYSLADDINQHLYIVFRGTKSKAQLLTEGWHSLQPQSDFYGAGKAHKYFSHALEALWANVEQALVEHPNYAVTFTGHSLGGALASLAALKTVLFGLRNSNDVKLYTFGQPRVGNVVLAQKYNLLVPQSYRIVHGVDIVPHLPGCAKDEIMGASSHPCDPDDLDRPYHHGTEIYYPHEMRENSPYFECLGAPFGEDYNCSDALTFIPEHHFQYAYAHRHYFEHKVPPFGKLGCQGSKQQEERLPSNYGNTENHHHTFKSLANKLRLASQFLETKNGKIPYLEFNGHQIFESYAIHRFIARKYGFAGKNEFEEALVDGIAYIQKDFHVAASPWLYAICGYRNENPDDLKAEYLNKSIDHFLPIFTNYLKEGQSGFLVSSGLTWVDFVITEWLISLLLFEPILDKYPELQEYLQRVRNIPELKNYYSTRKEEVPIVKCLVTKK